MKRYGLEEQFHEPHDGNLVGGVRKVIDSRNLVKALVGVKNICRCFNV